MTEPVVSMEPVTVAMTPIKQIVIICGLIFMQDHADRMNFQGQFSTKEASESAAEALRQYHRVPVFVISEDQIPQLLREAGYCA